MNQLAKSVPFALLAMALLLLPQSALAQDDEDYYSDEDTLAEMFALAIEDKCPCPEDGSEKSLKRLEKCLNEQQKSARGKMSKVLKFLSLSSKLFKNALAENMESYSELCLSGEDDAGDFPDEELPRDDFPGNDLPGDEFPGDTPPGDQFPTDQFPDNDGPGDYVPPPPPR